jgi:hypothetical protein
MSVVVLFALILVLVGILAAAVVVILAVTVGRKG